MALFSRKTKKDLPAAPSAAAQAGEVKAVATKQSGASHSFAHVLHNPRITEKASMHMERSTYVFDVDQSANKKQIMSAIQAVYKVKPRKVAIVNIRRKTTRNMKTGKSGMKGGGKKAYVYLNKGETITVT